MKISKGCILAAGKGTRLLPLTETKPKPLIPIAGKPLLQHSIEMFRENNITKILLIVGHYKEKIEEFFGNGADFGVEISYIEQKEFLGTAHATNLAKNFADQDPFLLFYGDQYMDSRIFEKILDEFSTNTYDGLISAKYMEDPEKWGILKSNKEGFLENLIEKPPDNRYGNLANAGVYIFNQDIFEGIANTEKSLRGEYELTDSIQYLVDRNKKIKIVDISNYYWNGVGYPWQILETNHHIISEMNTDLIHSSVVEEGSVTIKGIVEIGENTLLKAGTYIEGPLIIGKNCVIGPNAYLRPYSTIGDNCKIGNSSEIKASIIMNHTAVPHLSYVGDSIIGEHVNLGCGTVTANVRLDKKNISMELKGNLIETHKRKLGAFIGDYASIGINVNIMPGKCIGSYCEIGSNTIISKNVPANSLLFTKPKQQQILRKK
ncbi:bifunctional sugar-1-phosphate nucleotidylyltransferase/acetyltransferase [Promethearchaeum syntrophicum]|uniref:Bifunctional sugar-1-phosphate nucleotidylyltransferase/acetyltransferase n=1 Tax=Promethearchaeum syntrophicum TaxID=2594042 RepID=A0A5B9DC68_9ARCH|nr:bifunctional sugar-1-phosphate nucleotidylyltransferase/acetyltransferase [Candidatus Prometheoarchaeum syntrophicum]QEE16889.1 Bifunctional protein GlmU [Candidatus Prometheoarchaeum syntrophicum]